MNKTFHPCTLALALLAMATTCASAITFTNIYVFSPDGFNNSEQETNADGVGPDSVVMVGNILYGTASSGGAYGGGTFFRVNTDGTHFTNLFSFNQGGYDSATVTYTNSTGMLPNPGLLLVSNVFYGTTFYGGVHDAGIVFKVNPDGSDFSVVHSFGFTDGASPASGLTLYNGLLYGTTAGGGTNENGSGTLYTIDPADDSFGEVYQFTNYAEPYGGVAVNGEGIFGFAYYAGMNNDGYVYRIGGGGFADLFDFDGANGSESWATPTLSGNTLYGATFAGGTNGYGNIFRIDTDGQNYTNLYNFPAAGGANTTGAEPYEFTGLVLSGNTLYGTASLSGSGGQGTVFKISTSGTGFDVLHSFEYSDGGQPGQLILSGGTLYGAALVGVQGISLGDGSVFKMVLFPTLNLLPVGTNVVLSWNDPSYSLYTAPTLTNSFTKVTGATSPYTNALTGKQKYFKIQ